MTLTLISYNIHYGVGQDGRLDLGRIADTVRHGDIVALQEVERYWDRSGNADQVAELAELLPDHDWAYGPAIEVLKTGEQPARGRRRRRQFGNMVLSRWPIQAIRNHLFPKYGGTRFLEQQKGALEASIDTPDGPLRVYSTHLDNLSATQRLIQAELLLDIVMRAPREGPQLLGSNPDASWTSEPPLPPVPEDVVIMGDLNFVPETPPYATLVGELSLRHGRLDRRGGLIDAWHAADERSSDADGFTVHTNVGGPDRRIDYCLLSERLAPRVMRAEVIAEAAGSDHLPVIVTLAGLDR